MNVLFFKKPGYSKSGLAMGGGYFTTSLRNFFLQLPEII